MHRLVSKKAQFLFHHFKVWAEAAIAQGCTSMANVPTPGESVNCMKDVKRLVAGAIRNIDFDVRLGVITKEKATENLILYRTIQVYVDRRIEALS
jgi:hypothetical protein